MLIRLLRFLFGVSKPALPKPQAPSSLAGRELTNPLDRTTENVSVSTATEAARAASAVAKKTATTTGLNGLDASKFAPITIDEALSASAKVDWKSAYYDSRGVIPPANLPRIQVIDRTMVGMGLISDQELAEIHDIGEKMVQFQSDTAFVATAGERAVTESREERQQRKEQKRAHAETRRTLHREQVAQRKATDIVFLGRGVSRGLADRRSNIELLQSNALPVLSSPADLAKAMDISISQLRWLAFHSDAPTRVHYVSFDIPKKSGGTRRLSAPHQQLAAAQRWILTNILNLLPVHENAHGFVAQHSVVTNATPHVGSTIVINTAVAIAKTV